MEARKATAVGMNAGVWTAAAQHATMDRLWNGFMVAAARAGYSKEEVFDFIDSDSRIGSRVYIGRGGHAAGAKEALDRDIARVQAYMRMRRDDDLRKLWDSFLSGAERSGLLQEQVGDRVRSEERKFRIQQMIDNPEG